MIYEDIEQAGTVEVEYEGDVLDAYSLGVMNIHIQDITDEVSLWLLSQYGLIEPTWRRPRYLPNRLLLPQTIVRARINLISSGSFLESVGFAIAIVIADNNVRSVLHGLASQFVWAIGASGVKGVIRQRRDPLLDVPPLRRPDPFEVGPNVREIITTCAENSDNKDIQIKFKSKWNNQEDTVEVRIMSRG